MLHSCFSSYALEGNMEAGEWQWHYFQHPVNNYFTTGGCLQSSKHLTCRPGTSVLQALFVLLTRIAKNAIIQSLTNGI